MKTLSQPAQSGFTLLEVLIALALMAVLAMLSWQALDTTARTSEQLSTRTDDTLGLMRVFGQIETDLARHAGRDILPGGGGALPPGIRLDASGLTVWRSTPEGGWQEVVWTLADHSLRRAAGPAYTALPLPPAREGQIMLDAISQFSVRAWLPGQGWAPPDRLASDKTPATGLEILIERRLDDTRERYRKVVMLP